MDCLVVDFEANMGHLRKIGFDEIIQFSGALFKENESNPIMINDYLRPKFGFQKDIEKVTKIFKKDLKVSTLFPDFIQNVRNKYDLVDVMIVSFDSSDIQFLLTNMGFYGLDIDWITKYIDLQKVVVLQNKLDKNPSLINALELYNIPFIGYHHNSYHDLLNTVRLFNILKGSNEFITQIINHKEMTGTFNPIVRYKVTKDQYLLTQYGRKIIKNIFDECKHLSTQEILESSLMKNQLQQYFVNTSNQRCFNGMKRYINYLHKTVKV